MCACCGVVCATDPGLADVMGFHNERIKAFAPDGRRESVQMTEGDVSVRSIGHVLVCH